MLKDRFDTTDREHSQNRTWVSLLSHERSCSNKYVDLKGELESYEPLAQTEETIFSKSIFLKNSPVVDQEYRESTKTSVHCIERILLIYEEGEATPSKYVLTAGSLTVGRGKENHIVTSDPRASRKHFLLEVKPNLVELIDFSSENGTKVNGVNIRKCLLEDGDNILVGKTVFIFKVGSNSDKFFNNLELNFESNTVLEKWEENVNHIAILSESPIKVAGSPEQFPNQEKNTRTGRSRKLWGEIRQFSWTIAVTIFFVVATSCLVLGGAMIGQVFQEGKMEKLQLFYHELGRASHMAALGDMEHAERVMNEVRHLFVMDATQRTYFKDTEFFIEAIRKLSAEKQSKNYVPIEKTTKVKAVKTANKIVHVKPVKLDEKWRQAIYLYKNGQEKSCCNLVKVIFSQSKKTSPLRTKAQSFLERRCF